MSWAGRDHRAYLAFAPAALAGMLAPYAALPAPGPRVCAAREGMAGMALGAAAVAGCLAAAGYHSAFVFAAWAAAALLSLLAPAKARSRALSFVLAPVLSTGFVTGLWVQQLTGARHAGGADAMLALGCNFCLLQHGD